jgi:outer membrane lipase/esterase
MKHTLRILALSLLVIGLASCGGSGGGSTNTNPAGITSVRVFGDSLADGGTFGGIKFTVNNAGPGGSATPIWPELVAKTLGIAEPCPFFKATSFTNFVAPAMACKNFAVGGAKINNAAADGGTAAPYSISKQINSSFAVNGAYSASELILIDGGGNDANALVTAYVSGAAAFGGFVGNIVTPTDMGAASTAANPALAFGNAYMKQLAVNFATEIKTNLLAKGAAKVAVVNIPAISNTPLFKSNFAAQPAAVTAAVTALVRAWIETYNSTLVQQFSGEARVAIVDLFTDFDNQVNNPAQFGLTNVTTPVCTAIATPPYCFAQALDASPIAATWRSYAFSDGFHPTPYGHVLASQLINKTLAIKGWM